MYCAYLRKSRLDIEAERHGDMETLKRQEQNLLDFAKRNNLPVSKIYKEVVSGESLDARPEAQKLLEEVEQGIWDGVLVVEIERLARGDTIDQGIVARAFKRHNTKIITPIKTYNPANEFDEEYFEFGLFMSRREYKTITRRIQRGRVQSAKEGKFLSSVPPYGYDKVKIKDQKGYTLVPNKDEAPVVKMIFDLYISGSGMTVIAGELDRLGIKPRHRDTWSKSTISDILKNPVYTGKIRWSYKKEFKNHNNTGQTHREIQEEFIFVDGLHDAIISEKVFNQALEARKNNTRKAVKKNLSLQNPLSGVVHCKLCGSPMTRLGANSKNPYDALKCSNRYCNNVSAPIYLVEEAIINSTKEWLKRAEMNVDKEYSEIAQSNVIKNNITRLENEIKTINLQIQKTFDLLEQGIYDTETFSQRSSHLASRKKETEKALAEQLTAKRSEISLTEIKEIIIPRIKALINSYFSVPDTENRNTILKTILNDVLYKKTVRNTRGKRDTSNFELELFPRLFSDYQL